MTEHAEQSALINWANTEGNHDPRLLLLYAIPNGTYTTRYGAAKAKAEGLKSGVPDLCLPVASANYHGLYIEMKSVSPTGRRYQPRAEQREWIKALREEGYAVAVCHDWEEAKNCIIDYLTGNWRIAYGSI